MLYLILPVFAGIAITLQGTLSSKMGTESGFYPTILMIHLFGLLAAILIYVFIPNKSLHFVSEIKWWYVFAGALGVGIVFFISKSINLNGVLITVMISVLIQMISSKVIEHFGLFGIDKNPIDLKQLVAILIMTIGVIIYQVK